MLLAYKPSALAADSNAALLYQPALPGLFSEGGLSKNTPKVSALPAKAGTIREASPYPVDEPIIKTFFGQFSIGVCERS